MLIADAIKNQIEGGSWIRRMFEAGIALKQEFGEENVCDFSLGNPDLPPPHAVGKALYTLADKVDQPFSLGYMQNAGFPFVRKTLAQHLSKEQGINLTADDVILSCGAAGALNALFKAILNPGDEVLAISPCFVEYGAYVNNHNGVFCTVPSRPDTFSLDIAALEQAVTTKTRAVIINSPNNPTGQIYGKKELEELCDLLMKKSLLSNRPIFLVADEPYRFLAYDGIEVPSLLPLYPWAVVVSSFSKSLSLAGERIGYAALSPRMEGKEELMAGLTLANRILGFVNPPVIGQYLVEYSIDAQVDISVYLSRRDAMAEVLTDAGYEFFNPKGAFYFFPKAPGGDDKEFTSQLVKQKILAVPGSGFYGPGHFRLAFCLDESIIYRAAEGLKKAIQQYS